MYLFDTDILIDYLRLHKPAIRFLESFTKEKRNVAFISQFELLQGCSKKAQSNRVGTFLKYFKILPMDSNVSKQALQIYRDKRWHAHIDIPDAFIAASAIKNNLTLVTRNLKHYKNIEGLKVEKPY